MTADDELARVVAWLRQEAELCDCFARSASECACGAWDDYKRIDPRELADRLARHEHRETNDG